MRGALEHHGPPSAPAFLGAQAGQARFNILAQLTKLRRAACDPRLTSPEFGIAGAKVQVNSDGTATLL